MESERKVVVLLLSPASKMAGGMALRKLGEEDRYLGKTEIVLGRTCVTLVLLKIACKCRGFGLMSPVSVHLDCHHLNIGTTS